ncbi:MAG: aspartate/glutamate racemase family protein [Pseudomonadota bacterium]|nr:aspartate/glutamate racemase family protein [Pseudomonadota bacterium]
MQGRLIHERCASDRPLSLSIADVEGGADTFSCMSAVGQALRDEDCADVIMMGCAGMAKHRAPLEDALGVAGG